MADSPEVVHELDVDAPGGGRRRVIASFWRGPDTWRLEAFDIGSDAQGELFTPRPDLTADVHPEAIDGAEVECRERAEIQRGFAAPHLALAVAFDAQAVMVARLTDELAEVGAPEPAEPLRAPTPSREPEPEPKLRRAAPGGRRPGVVDVVTREG